jgi:hypothetical protein
VSLPFTVEPKASQFPSPGVDAEPAIPIRYVAAVDAVLQTVIVDTTAVVDAAVL